MSATTHTRRGPRTRWSLWPPSFPNTAGRLNPVAVFRLRAPGRFIVAWGLELHTLLGEDGLLEDQLRALSKVSPRARVLKASCAAGFALAFLALFTKRFRTALFAVSLAASTVGWLSWIVVF